MNQESRTESPQINPHIYGQLIVNESAEKKICWKKNGLVSANGTGTTGYPHVKQ